jgi:hypothetical protein
MKIFMLDLWHDLREKRLWPVAVVLAVGLLAVPVLLAKPAEDPAPAPVVDASASKSNREQLAALAQVKLGEEKVGSGSTLGVFDPANPFRPPKGVMKKQVPEGSSEEPGPGSNSASSDDGSSTGGSGGSGGSDDGTSGGGTTPDTGGTPGGVDGGETTTTVYKYVVDLTFTANGRKRRITGLEKLDMLPSQSSPLLIFMGVTANGSNAVFLVDSTLKAAGEGRCKPSEAECAFAYIGPGSEYMFTSENGDSYQVAINEIRKVKVSGDGQSAKAGRAEGAKAHASVGPQRRFVPPLMADLVVVANESLEDSNSQTESR